MGYEFFRVELESSPALRFGDYAFITVEKSRLDREEVHPRLWEWFEKDVNLLSMMGEGSQELVPHPGFLPGDFENAGETCLKITFDEEWSWAGQWLFHGYDKGEGLYYGQLVPGADYRAELWLRQEGMEDPSVWFTGVQACFDRASGTGLSIDRPLWSDGS